MKKRFSAKVLVVVFAIALLATSFMVPTVSSAAEPTNLVPADLFASPEKAAQWFERVSTDPTYYTKDGNDYVMRVNTQNSAWTYSNQEIPYDTFTIRLFVQPIAYYKEKFDSDVYGGMGMVLGTGSGNGFPWVDTRIDFNLDTTETVDFYIWEHHGSVNGMVKRFGGEWYDDFGVPQWFADEGMEGTPGWFEVVYEFTADETKMYVDGFEVPDMATEAEHPTWADVTMGHLPTASELTWFGFFSEGGTEGFYIKNFGIYEGVGLFTPDEPIEDPSEDATEEPSEDPTEEPSEDATQEPSDDATEDPSEDVTEAPSYDATEEPEKKDKGNSNLGLIIGIVVAVVVVAAGAVVAVILIKKKK